MKNKMNLLVAHYELMNDGRYILLFEPNVFDNTKDAEFHSSALRYLSGRDFMVIPEKDLKNYRIIVDDIL